MGGIAVGFVGARFQLMGKHCSLLRFDNPQSMVLAISRIAQAHLEAFGRYVEGTPACPKGLLDKNWPMFARGYNDTDCACDHHDTKLAAACARLSAWLPPQAPAISVRPRLRLKR